MTAPIADAFNEVVAKLYAWVEAAILMLPNLAAALVVVVAFWLAARVASRLTSRVLHRATSYEEINRLLTRVVWIVVLAAGLFIALGILQLDKTVTSLIAGAGILTLVVGLAFQDLTANFVAGLLLQLRHPFRKGHLIRTNDFYGVVEHINLRATILRTPTGQVAVIPNKDVFQSPLVNFSEPDQEAQLFYEGFGASAIDFTLRFWIAFGREPEYLLAKSDAEKRIKRAFDAHGVTVPFPIRTLDFSRVCRDHEGGRAEGHDS